jgi:three-Cys-motif partner protein
MPEEFAEFDEIGYWSEIKLEIVRDYASAYSRILNSKNLPHVYIDAFAGAGQHISKNTGEFVPGSPLNALNGSITLSISTPGRWNFCGG